MIAGKLQVEQDFDCFIESETMSTTTESPFDNQGGRNTDKTQVDTKMKKLRSIKLSRIPSTRKGRSTSSQFRTKLSGYAASSEQSTPIEMSDASPNHINATNLENFQILPTTESGFKLLRSVTRKPSMKFRRPQMKKKSSKRDVNAQDMNKKHLQSSSSCSGSSFDNSDQDKNISANEKQQLAYPANKSIRVVRTSTLGPMKILTKMASLRSKRTKKCSEIPSIPDSNVEKDTCSSTLKSSKFRDHLEIKQGGNESDGTAALNVCRYSYCSLHGHRHGDKPPPLKRFVSMRRRAAKSQKSWKPDPKSSGKPKQSGNRKKGVQSEKRVLNGDTGVADQQTTVDIREVPFVAETEGSDFVDLAESVPGESSYPSHEERQSPETFQVFKDIGVDCSEIGGQQKAMCDTSIKIEETERINNGDRKSIQALDRLKGGYVSSKEFRDPTKFDNLSCNASVPLAKESHRDIDEDLASSSNLKECEGHSGDGVKTLETISTGDSCEVPNSFFSSAHVTAGMEKPTSAIEDKNGGSDLDSRFHQPVDPMAASNCTDLASKKEMENQKNFTFWKLIYRQMATGLDAEPETQTPHRGMNSEEQAEDLLDAHDNNDSCQENSREAEDHEASNLKLEFSQSDAIKLVQQAFDKILSEIPDNSSDDQSIVSEKTSDHEFLLKQDEGKEVSISTSSNSSEDCMLQDREKMKIQTDKELMPEEEKAAQKEGKRSDTQMPSSWSSLKKIIILRRFVKSLEKVRNLKPKKFCYLPPAKDQEAENIQMRPQTEKGKKNAEEWMLDLALRQVISSLAPSQKRKVAMLVQAFETVIPADNGDDMRYNVAASCPTTSVEAYNEFLIDNGDGTENQIGSEISSGKPLYSEMDFTANHDQSSESNISYQQLKRSSLDSKETSLLRSCKYKQLCTAGSEMSGTDMKKEDTGTGVMEEQTSAVEENEGSDLDSRILQPADPMADTNSRDVASKKDMENQKNFTFWKIIYRQMATSLDAEPETQTPCPGKNSEEKAEDLMNAHEKNDSCWEISRPDQATIIEDHEASNRKLEFSQSDAIKLVQQAFDKILSEIPDNSSDDQSIVSEKTSDQEILLKKQDEGKEVSISTSSNSIENCTIPYGEEMKLQTDKEIVSGKQMPSSWSYLKKIIILKRFVKSLEKVRNLKPKTIRYLPPTKDQEAENIQLRPQTEKGKKNAEEWMLDLALRQVISTLAPSQKRKVAMLVQAFETIIPAENGDVMRSNVAASSPTTSVQAYNEFLVDNGDSTENLIRSEISPGKLTCKAGSEMSGTDMKKEDTCAVDDNNGNEVSIVDHSFSELEEPRLAHKSLVDEVAIKTSHDKNFPVNEDVIQPISKEETSVYSSEVCNAGSEISIKKMDLASNDSSNSPDQQPDTPEWPAEVGEGAQRKYKFLHTSLEQSESNFVPDISTSERQKYTRLWYLIYKHMVSDSAKENGSQPLANEEVQCNDASQCPMENNADCQASFAAGHSNEIIKLVEEAIDEIPLPETQDITSDNQSVIGDVIPDQELLEKKQRQEEVKIISISTDSAKENFGEAKTIRAELCSTFDSKEKILSSENVDTKMEAKERTEEGNKSKKRVQRNWSNLKKLVLLRRFVKALERVEEFNPRGPRFLPVDPAQESEKVLLRQQNMGDKKSAEEWMLDYALQQVVAKLTPERKRRVGLLVEAFETVIPTIS